MYSFWIPVGLALLLCGSVQVQAGSAVSGKQKEAAIESAKESLIQMVHLWKEGRYAELYELGTSRSRQRLSLETFSARMRSGKRSLQCCWATIQDVRGSYESASRVTVQAKLGYRTRQPATRIGKMPSLLERSTFERESFRLVFREGHWRINLFRLIQKGGGS